MKTMCDEIILGKIPVKNRFVRSATFEYGGDENGRFRQNMYDTAEKLSKGGVGLLITGMVAVDENAGINQNMIKAFDDTFPSGMQKLADLVHRHGSKIVVQIAHCGVKVKKTDAGLSPVAASKLPDTDYRKLSRDDIRSLAGSFATAALRCRETGADGIQIHAAHGYLLNEFLSPLFNRRTDDYGGTIENRARIVFDVYRAIRDAVGNDYPVWIKINASDMEKGGMSFEESIWVCGQLSEMGIDAIEISGGVSLSPDSAPARKVSDRQEEAYFAREAKIAAENLKADVIGVGGYRTPDVLNEKLNERNIKAIALCRPFICEPGLVNRWKSGGSERAKCVSCNRCFTPGPLSCKVFPENS